MEAKPKFEELAREVAVAVESVRVAKEEEDRTSRANTTARNALSSARNVLAVKTKALNEELKRWTE